MFPEFQNSKNFSFLEFWDSGKVPRTPGFEGSLHVFVGVYSCHGYSAMCIYIDVWMCAYIYTYISGEIEWKERERLECLAKCIEK